jgi:hypothetical protein
VSESGEIRGIIIHADEITVTAGRALDTPAVGLTLNVAEGGVQRFALSLGDAEQLAKDLRKAAREATGLD